MFKIISAELKKIVSKPGIYILSVLLAAVLVLGVFIYKPTVYENTSFELNGATYVEKYTHFTGDGHANAGKKAESDAKLSSAIESIESYRISYLTETLTQKSYIETLLNQCNEAYDAYRDSATDSSNQNRINTLRTNLVASFENLNLAIENAFINSQYGSYSIVSSISNYEAYKSSYKQVLAWAKISVDKINLTAHFNEFESKFKDAFYSSITNFKYPTISDNFIQTYTTDVEGTKLSTLNKRLNSITIQINEHLTLSSNDPTGYNSKHANKMDELANLYCNTIDTYVNLIKYELITNAFENLSTKEQLDILYLSRYNNFNANSMLVRYEYMFDNNKTDADFSNPLTIGVASNGKTNAYDYAYFVLKLFSFVLIIYAVMSACHSIAGEIKDGTIKQVK